ncbi:hypothetical protein SAMN06264364_1495 [Quadrisphaera granulorum]|uniref:Uncharacterized protein n=1 Tax=Quadrisphaera granulorum TaxID=317664 RepID=A0A315ZM11_9ACTN|nr:hypothetical protein [Quadrisphaera granulorum]PWJ46269.1 hypothetical protein BXY45_1495 [Quadrisphaera granulorum]SZE99084.1 hypothetical protein SAMN06264364_1495 [Quadrisphaera granulorum]
MSGFSVASAASPHGDFRAREHAGSLVLIRRRHVIAAWVTPGAIDGQPPRSAVAVDVVVLTDGARPHALRFPDQTITSTGLMRAIMRSPEPWVLGRLDLGSGGAWLLAKPSAEDRDRAARWLVEHDGGDDQPPRTRAQEVAEQTRPVLDRGRGGQR